MANLSAMSDEELLSLYEGQSKPRGVRNRNPLNVKATVPWNGMTGQDGEFAVFDTMEDGIAAADRNLQTYGSKHGINTLSGVVSRWAPPNADGNHTANYISHVAKATGLDPEAEIDLAQPETRRALLGAMAEFENGEPLPEASPLAAMSDEQLLALYQGQGAAQAAPVAQPRPAPPPRPQDAPQGPMRRDQVLGLQKGAIKPLDNAAIGLEWLVDKVTGSTTPGRFSHMLGQPSAREAADSRKTYLADQERKGVLPGRVGEFAGNVLGTLPLAALPGGPLTQGAASGAALSDAKDAKGLAIDTAVGGVAGVAADKALKLVGKGVSSALAKAPNVPKPSELKAVVDAAYDKVRAAGIVIPKADAQALAGDVTALIRQKGGPKAARLYADADALASRMKALAAQKGGVPISQLEELRSDIYAALVKPGGKEAPMGVAMRQKIDAVMDKVAAGNPLLREARELNTRLAKANAVNKRLDSADLAKRRAYTGSNGDNTIRQKMSPLIDPLHSARLRNATPDEAAALDRVVTGTGLQNLARTAGSLSDPRKLLGMGLQAGAAGPSGFMSLLSVPAGMAATTVSNRMSQKNVEALLQLIAAGGSKQALKKSPTAASRAAERALAKVRPGAGLVGAAAASQGRNGR